MKMKKLYYGGIIFLLFLNSYAQTLRQRTTLLMGGRFDITISADDAAKAEDAIEQVISEITRIENLISDWKSDSQISKVNQNAGISPIKVDKEVFELTRRALEYSRKTDGAFDVSFAAMDKIWKFDGSMTEMPSPDAVRHAAAKVGYRNILLDSINSTIFLKLQGMKIGFGALGEGYAADKCRTLMISRGITAGIVNASGDMMTWGRQPDGNKWQIGITNPFKTDSIFAVIPACSLAVTTSGSYQKFAVLNGKRYSHIINPATGYPSTGLCSVTVLGPSAETANALSTSVMVLGRSKAQSLFKKYKQYSFIIIDDQGNLCKSKKLHIDKFPKRIPNKT